MSKPKCLSVLDKMCVIHEVEKVLKRKMLIKWYSTEFTIHHLILNGRDKIRELMYL